MNSWEAGSKNGFCSFTLILMMSKNEISTSLLFSVKKKIQWVSYLAENNSGGLLFLASIAAIVKSLNFCDCFSFAKRAYNSLLSPCTVLTCV